MNVYIVIANNKESYENYEEWVDKVFDNKNKAERYIEKEEILYLTNNKDRDFRIEQFEIE